MKNLKRKKPDLVDAAALGEEEEEGKIQHTDKPDLVNNAALGEEESKLQPTDNKPDLVNNALPGEEEEEEEEIKNQFLQNLLSVVPEVRKMFIDEGRSFYERY